MKKTALFLMLSILIPLSVQAGTVERYNTYVIGGEATAENLEGNLNNIVNELNGGLDNENANTNDGFRFIEIVDSLPAAGNQGRVVFNTADTTLYFDDGAQLVAVAVLQNTQAFSGNNTFTGTTTLGIVSTADINGGTIDGTTIGGSTASPGSFTTLNASGTATFDGTTDINSTLTIGTTNQGDILYDNGTSIVRLTPSTSGFVLQTNGTSANPSWTNPPGLKHISTTSVSSVTNSGDVPISDGNRYKIVFQFEDIAGGARTYTLRFNSDSDASYADDGASGQTDIDIATVAATGGQLSGEILLIPFINDNQILQVRGVAVASDDAVGSATSSVNFSGVWLDAGGAANPTSFEIISDGNADMDIYVYQFYP